jgi:hypothetical protein
MTKSVVVGDHHPALLRAPRRRERWSAEDNRLYQRRRWRSEGYHGEAKTWHGLARAVRRGLQNMRLQAFLTAAEVNLKRLAAATLAALIATLRDTADALSMPIALRPQLFDDRPPADRWWILQQPHATTLMAGAEDPPSGSAEPLGIVGHDQLRAAQAMIGEIAVEVRPRHV